ncbi:spermidine synthase [Aeromicrobium sp. 50.2.37]|uniref:spermidine synthase n=1 Tax=Aeromicrobium sp. 50.2.37 TaxID=2969305 RepID=UPI00214FDE0F|nr:spermidine synthase [Aeromicrobium sp. 50.2.37]MCR4514680.1 spermidine synthase [Aeromicrobium sp. 50.2.37]
MVRFEELDWAETPWGLIVLRRRFDLATQRDVHEVKLGDDYLMSSQFTVSERALATLGLDAADGEELRVLVGGLGLGYTAFEALRDDRVTELVVVDALAPVISWHRDELFDDTRGLAADPRTRLVQDDFFDLARAERLERPVDVLLVDIDHAPDRVLRTDHGDFYTVEGQQAAARMLTPGGVFALWSDEPPDTEFVAVMRAAFAEAEAHVVTFDNPLTGGTSTATIYVARRDVG